MAGSNLRNHNDQIIDYYDNITYVKNKKTGKPTQNLIESTDIDCVVMRDGNFFV